MKTVILCGGLGTRLREETEFRPKPMVEIGGRPILWHIMKGYAHWGHRDFVLCLGYRGDAIRNYFLNYEVFNRDLTVTLGVRKVQVHRPHSESGWRVTLAETGVETLTAGRLKRVAHHLGRNPFLVTYGDGVADVDIKQLLAFHKSKGRLATVTAVRPPSRFGELSFEAGLAKVFLEKPQIHEGWINGGFFVFEPDVLKMIKDDRDTLEQNLLSTLAKRGQLAVYQHSGFWQCMDTYREMQILNRFWDEGHAPWAPWRKG